ncbi:MAG: DUF1622 domain-containing protein [Cyanobacteria bacterium SID2]|nr:DUF1622 domain-containing protein [Cyanobacteria bacterium SID2]MBP0003092.1 DUF1622 domain-containing protein [Cyanobacteria bacterium SBC]
MEFLEHALVQVVSVSKLGLEAISVLCVLLGFVATLRLLVRQPEQVYRFPLYQLRLCFGSWLALALEFQLGADILATTIAPSFGALGQLAALAGIRTFLNFFLDRELEAEAERQRQQQETFARSTPRNLDRCG